MKERPKQQIAMNHLSLFAMTYLSTTLDNYLCNLTMIFLINFCDTSHQKMFLYFLGNKKITKNKYTCNRFFIFFFVGTYIVQLFNKNCKYYYNGYKVYDIFSFSNYMFCCAFSLIYLMNRFK